MYPTEFSTRHSKVGVPNNVRKVSLAIGAPGAAICNKRLHIKEARAIETVYLTIRSFKGDPCRNMNEQCTMMYARSVRPHKLRKIIPNDIRGGIHTFSQYIRN